MRPAPSYHRIRSHPALLNGLVSQARHWFAKTAPSWDPARLDENSLVDLGRGLLDSYALALHILWTYQHVWSEEAFLATAQLPASKKRLLDLIGYRPDTGVAAAGLQHFRCKEGLSTTLPPGFRVKANAEGDKEAAEFETLRAVQVSSVLNEVRPFLPRRDLEPVSTVGSIAADSELALPETRVPLTQPVLGGGSVVGQLTDRISAARSGSLAQRNAARARQKALQLAEVARELQKQGAADICADTFQKLCEDLCKAQELANQAPQETTPGPLSESQDLLAGQLVRLANRRPDAMNAFEDALSKQDGESNQDWSQRLDRMVEFLDALVSGILQEARDQVVRLRGSRALTRLDRANGDGIAAPDGLDRGIASPGQDWLYLLPVSGDPELGPRTHQGLLRPGDFLAVGEDVERIGPDGERATQRRYREAVRIVRVRDEVPEGRREPMTRITFEPPLHRRYQLSRTVLLGNMAEISHGSTVVEEGVDLSPDGGDIRLSSSPLTWLRDPDPQVPEGRVPQVGLRVNDQDWTRVDDLRDQEPTAAAFVMEVTPEGEPRLHFGDDREGAALPARASVSIRYRVGVGEDGNRAAGAISVLASADPAIVSTFNPLTVSGGVAPEKPRLAEVKAIAGINSLDRAVSVADVRSLALTFGGVRLASVFRDLVRRREHLTVVVSGEKGAALTEDDRRGLRAFIGNRLPPGTSVTVDNRTTVPVRARLRIRIRRGADPIEIIQQVRIRLGLDDGGDGHLGLLHPDRVGLGQEVHSSDFYGALEEIEDLTSVFVELLYRADAKPARSDRIMVAPREIPVWADSGYPGEPLEILWEEAKDL